MLRHHPSLFVDVGEMFKDVGEMFKPAVFSLSFGSFSQGVNRYRSPVLCLYRRYCNTVWTL